MFLGIEIGGTKLQLGVGRGDGGKLETLTRLDVVPQRGAEGIRQQIREAGRTLLDRYPIKAVGIGFGGPVDSAAGRTIKSHQIDGWDDFPLAAWCEETFHLPAGLANDADSAGLAEACYGAGHGRRVVFYVTVGSGIGGALVVDQSLYTGGGGIASEIGHLRPGLTCASASQTIEAAASGWGIARSAVEALSTGRAEGDYAPARNDLLARCNGDSEQLTTKMLGQAAGDGNALAAAILHDAIRTLGWAVAQVITLLAPQVVVLGGGVPLLGERFFFAPLREEVARYVFPPLAGSYEILPAALGEEMVVYGAIALAARRAQGK